MHSLKKKLFRITLLFFPVLSQLLLGMFDASAAAPYLRQPRAKVFVFQCTKLAG